MWLLQLQQKIRFRVKQPRKKLWSSHSISVTQFWSVCSTRCIWKVSIHHLGRTCNSWSSDKGNLPLKPELACLSHKQCRTIGIEVSSQNVALSTSLIYLSFETDNATKIVVFSLIFGIFSVISLVISTLFTIYILPSHVSLTMCAV